MSNKKIGITEGGDAGLNFKWVRALREDSTLDGAVIITKCLNEEMLEPLLEHKNKVILHVTVTGYAGTVIEPNTPSVKSVKVLLKELREKGFPAEHLVLRIDPIIPSEKGIRRADRVFQFFAPLVSRVRISIIDMYPAVRERFHDAGLPSPYGREFAPSMAQINAVNKLIKSTWQRFLQSMYFATTLFESLLWKLDFAQTMQYPILLWKKKRLQMTSSKTTMLRRSLKLSLCIKPQKCL